MTPPDVHPTAVISPDAELAPGVTVAAFAVIDGPVRLGPGCSVGPWAHLIGPLSMGRDNSVGPRAVLGDLPQHLGYKGHPAGVEVGDGNVFGGRVTVNRAFVPGGRTALGSGNRLMAGSPGG